MNHQRLCAINCSTVVGFGKGSNIGLLETVADQERKVAGCVRKEERNNRLLGKASTEQARY